MRLVDHHEEVVGEEVEQRVRRGTRLAAVEVAGVVLDPRAEAELLEHLEVERRAHAQSLGFEQLLLRLELFETLLELVLDRADGPLHRLGARDVMRRGKDRHGVQSLDHIAGQRMEHVERLDLIAEHLDADRVLLVHRDDLDRVAADAEVAAREVDVVAVVLHRDELADERVAVVALPHLQRHHRAHVLLGRAEAVDARHGGDDHDVSAAEQRVRRRVPQTLDLGVDRGVLLDEGVGLRDVRLGLVVVVVADEVLDGVVGHELAELVRQLCREGLVVGEHQGRTLHRLDEPRGRGGLAGARRAEEHDVGLACVDARRQLGDRLRLIAARLVVADDLERSHGTCRLHPSSVGGATDIGAGRGSTDIGAGRPRRGSASGAPGDELRHPLPQVVGLAQCVVDGPRRVDDHVGDRETGVVRYL